MSFDSLLPNKCKVKSETPGSWLEPTSITGPKLPCRIEYGNKRIVDFKGEQVLSKACIFFKPSHMTFNEADKILLDNENFDREHSILLIDKPQNAVAIHHGEVYII